MVAAQMAYPYASERAVKRAVRKLPARDPLRADLRETGSTQHQGHLLIQNGQDVHLTSEDMVNFQAAVLAILTRGARKLLAIQEEFDLDLIDTPPLSTVAQRATIALENLILTRMQNDSDAISIPAGFIQSILRDVAGWPEELGYAPVAAGFTEIGAESVRSAAAAEPDMIIYYEWVHGFYGEPKQPDPVHVYLSGTVMAVPGVVEQRYPADHPGCTCTWLPMAVLPATYSPSLAPQPGTLAP